MKSWIARLHRFGHLLLNTLRLDPLHRAVDFYKIHPWIYPLEIGCTCGKVFWKRKEKHG